MNEPPLNKRVTLAVAEHLIPKYGEFVVGWRVGYTDSDADSDFFYDTGTEIFQKEEIIGWKNLPTD